MTYVKVIPIQTVEYDHETYLISQVRLCRKCNQIIEVIDGNHQLYFDDKGRLALHQHIQCPPPRGYFGDEEPTTHVMTPEEKQNFLYPK